MAGGVCAGIAEHFDLDPTLVRLGAAALTVLGGAGIPLYVAAWLLIPEEGSDRSVLADLLGPAQAAAAHHAAAQVEGDH